MKKEIIDRKEPVKKHPLFLSILGNNEMKSFKKGKRIERGFTSDVYEVTQEIKLAMKVLDIEMMNITKKKGDDDYKYDSEEEKHQELDIERAKKFLQES